MPEVRLIDANALKKYLSEFNYDMALKIVDIQPTIEPEVWHGRWIECDYKHIEHGMIEIVTNGGLFCSECGTAFQKKKMTYKQFCAACGARMDGDTDDDKRR